MMIGSAGIQSGIGKRRLDVPSKRVYLGVDGISRTDETKWWILISVSFLAFMFDAIPRTPDPG